MDRNQAYFDDWITEDTSKTGYHILKFEAKSVADHMATRISKRTFSRFREHSKLPDVTQVKTEQVCHFSDQGVML